MTMTMDEMARVANVSVHRSSTDSFPPWFVDILKVSTMNTSLIFLRDVPIRRGYICTRYGAAGNISEICIPEGEI